MLTITQVQSEPDIESARDLFREFTVWAISLQEGSEDAPTFANLEEELAALPGKYSPPSGRLLMARQDDVPAGCVALVAHDAQTCELKRMYVRPAFRGHGIGGALVRTLLDEAQKEGFERMVLDSHKTMTSAHRIYAAYGFRETPAPEGFPEWLKPIVVFMEREL